MSSPLRNPAARRRPSRSASAASVRPSKSSLEERLSAVWLTPLIRRLTPIGLNGGARLCDYDEIAPGAELSGESRLLVIVWSLGGIQPHPLGGSRQHASDRRRGRPSGAGSRRTGPSR